MAKNSIRDYSATNSSNTDIQSIDISEGCSPAGINNAIREVMADLKDVSTGAVALESPAFDSASLTGDLTFGDNDKAIFGAGSDLQIYHDGSNSRIQEAGTGNLIIRASAGTYIQGVNGENGVVVLENGAASLWNNGLQKLAATATGVDVTGAISSNKGSAGTLATFTDGVNSNFVVETSSLLTTIGNGGGSTALAFKANNTERMRIDSSGNVLVGTTTGGGTIGTYNGFGAFAGGSIFSAATSNRSIFSRRSTDGNIIDFRRDSTTVGSIGCAGTNTFIVFRTEANGDGTGLRGSGSSTGAVIPTDGNGDARDNGVDLGGGSSRFDDIYATNGNIQTSDQNEKQQIAALTDAEMTAAKAISALFKTFKWNKAVEDKGDAARTHAGVIAQDVQAAMTAAGLNAGDYAFFISSTWWETQTEVPAVEAVEAVYEDVVIPAVLDEDGNEVEAERTEQRTVTEAVEAVAAYTRTDTYETSEEAPEGAVERTRLGIRYPELLAFVGAATEQRLGNIETRLAALEAN